MQYWIWQFPQMLAGVICVKTTGAVKQTFITKDGRIIAWHKFNQNKNRFNQFFSGASLAMYVILPEENEPDIRHEHGHSRQSLYLGPLYLPIIGIYSAVFCNLWDRLLHKSWDWEQRDKWYYGRWTEAWADKLGGAKREWNA